MLNVDIISCFKNCTSISNKLSPNDTGYRSLYGTQHVYYENITYFIHNYIFLHLIQRQKSVDMAVKSIK